MSLNLREIPVNKLHNIGPQRASLLGKCGFKSIYDLLFYFPYKYIDRSKNLNIATIKEYLRKGYEGEVTFIAKVVKKEFIYLSTSKVYLKVFFADNTGIIEGLWFNSAKIFDRIFLENKFFALSGKPVLTRYGNLQIAHPDFDKVSDQEEIDFVNTGKIIPFYSLPAELKKNKFGDFSFRNLIKEALDKYAVYLEETLSDKILQTCSLMNIKEAVANIHFPESQEKLDKARRRFKFEEIFYYQLAINYRKALFKEKNNAPILKPKSSLIKDFVNSLPFKLTEAQLSVLSEIRKDLESSKPMNRLLQGDVGSGKTIVALIACLFAVDNNYQVAILAPTEILAIQHYKNIEKYLTPFNIEVLLTIGGPKTKKKKDIIETIKTKSPLIIIGTHALLEDYVEFNNLGMAIIDEQHRFGVEQRAKLIKKGFCPHILSMTATPIPRTLTMTIYGDLDVSIIAEKPQGRKPIKTVLRSEKSLPKIYQFIVDKVKEGVQTYIVYPLVEESEKLELKAALSYYETLKENELKNVRVGLLHGKMNWSEKEEIMKKFAAKEFDVLIATTVIEVGIDVPDANIILINDAHRFGLSQLHQLRGRVGRSDKQGLCILVSKESYVYGNENELFEDDEYLMKIEKNKQKVRLRAMLKYNDGFKLSEIDLRLRGPGNIIGVEQSGIPKFKLIDLSFDDELISISKRTVEDIITSDPFLTNKDHVILKSVLEKVYKDKIELASIA